MANPAWQVWICGNCRRRVPAQLVECRCGGLKAHALGTIGPDSGADEGSPLWPRLFGAMGIGAVLAGSWLWFSRTPDAVRSAGPLVTFAPPTTFAAQPAAPRQMATPAPAAPAPTLAPGAWPPRSDPPPHAPAGGWPVVGATAPPAAPEPSAEATPPPTTVVSETDRVRQAGMQRLRSEFQAMKANAVSLISMDTLYVEGCRGQAQPPEHCANLINEINRMAVAVGAAIERTEDIARTSYLDPGVVRDMREQVGMEDPFWDELERVTREYRR